MKSYFNSSPESVSLTLCARSLLTQRKSFEILHNIIIFLREISKVQLLAMSFKFIKNGLENTTSFALISYKSALICFMQFFSHSTQQ